MRSRKGQLWLHLGVLAVVASLAVTAPAATAAPGGGKPKLSKGERKRLRLRKMRIANKHQKRPNVVVIETDDQSNSLLGMDDLARLLVAKGTTFANSYVSFPLCCPSRATFLTGQYSHNHGVFTTELPNGYNGLDHSSTLAVWLRSSGYRTAMVGKYLNGYGIEDGIPEAVPDAREVPPGWAEWDALTGGLEQRRYKYKLNENGKVHFYGKGAQNYVTDVLGSKAATFVKRQAPKPKPFFLWFTPTAPHAEAGRPPGATRDPEPALRHLGRFETATAPRNPNFNEADVSDKPDFVRNADLLDPAAVADIDIRYRGQLESLLSVDEAIQRLFNRVKKAGDKRKTYFIFTSDNGLQMGAHRLLFKSYLYQESVRVPLIIRGPGFPAGAVRNQPVSNVDLAPTILGLTRVAPGRVMDGRSLVREAADPNLGMTRDLLFESELGTMHSDGLLSGQWKYIEHDTGERELYDLQADPWELNNQAANPAYAAIRNQLAARLGQLKNCAGAACP
jgi:N-acetylglucosamine-6-sulfatase